MISEAVKEALQKFIPLENISYMEPMNEHTTFRVGGNADCFIKMTDSSPLPALLGYLNRVEIPYFIMGNGSNVLVSDQGYAGIIIQFADGFSDIRVEGCRLYAKAGAFLSKVAIIAREHGLTGLEFAAGIPGTVGGGVVMNAGAYDGEMKLVVESVTVLDREGNELELSNDTMEFGYRTSAIKNNPFIVTECCFLLKEGDKSTIAAKMEDFQNRRKEKQPLEYPSAGSTFKRPEGHFAGKLIMDAGLRGTRIGGAQVSEKHSGFIINTGNATASDLSRLIAYVQEEVYNQFSVRLEPEVIYLGNF
ncbi:MAG TPA: UDP-N-acetylmuramate dehydrogenase [Lachnospiraceae bacterium]|nr:UDP-N-acetylmuramate dehydrogenase [Lachnospiraceae bacterium]